MQQQPGGSQFGVPPQTSSDMPAFPGSGRVLGIPEQPPQPPPEAPSPISTRAPPANFDELGPAMAGSFAEDEALAAAGEEGERGGAPGNRWPRQETLALLKIRSDMDAAFRDATLKGPLWDEVSRKLAELGYKRNAKKCKEKFENVHKYYKRTKDGRAGRQDGKSYRFFTELEALHSGAGSSGSVVAPKVTSAAATIAASQIDFSAGTMSSPVSGRTIQASPISAAAPPQIFTPQPTRPVIELTPSPIIPTTAPAPTNTTGGLQAISAAVAAAGISFSSNSSSSDSFESDDEGTEDATEASGQRSKRSREGGHLGSRKKMMVLFEGLMKQVVEKQEAMQQRFLETIEKREQDRMIREEAWRRQEMARLSREQELLAQERAVAANRDATLISYLQKLSSSQPVPIPTTPASTIPTSPVVVTTTVATPATSPPPAPPSQSQKPVQLPQKQPPSTPPPPPPPSQLQNLPTPAMVQPLQQQPPPPQPPPSQPNVTPQHDSEHLQLQISPSSEVMSLSELPEGAASNRWPKAEVHALIKIRSGLDARYQEAGPKGPLWEEISVEMQKLGYNRNSKRCKEKWENINKYYKKVKESNKKRPEDAKTCPYFHQLDALYRQKQLNVGSTSGCSSSPVGISSAPERAEPLSVKAPAPLTSQMAPVEGQSKNGNDSNPNGGNSQAVHQVQANNGGFTQSFFEEGMKKPEDIMKELMKQRHQQAMMESYDNDGDSDTMDEDDDDDDEDDDENRKLQYKIQFQRPNVGANGGEGGNSSAMNSGSFLAIVQ